MIRELYENLSEDDKLEAMFRRQIELQKALNIDIDEVDLQYLKDQTLALMVELGEFMNELPWKPWKASDGMTRMWFRVNRSEHNSRALGELIDCWHFLINITLALGISPEHLFGAFEAKNYTNKQRQLGGY